MTNRRLNATISIGGTVARSLTKGLTDTKGQLAEVGGAIRNAESQQRRLSREIESMGRAGMNIDPLRRRYAQLSDEIDRLRRRQEALNRLAAADVGGKFRTMTTEVGRLARRTAILGGAAAGGIFAVANSTSELGDNVAKTADKLGMGIQELQAYRYAAERSGIATATFDMATQRMVRRVAEAAQGTGEAKDAIAELGLSAEALASMTPDEQLNHFADALRNVENQGDRVRLAMKLFDSEGVAMVNMLRDGSEGLRQYGEDARRTGYILSEQAARDAETFQDTLLDTKLSLFGLKNIIGSALMPVVSDMMGQFTGWLAENRDQVRQWSATFADKLKAAVPIIGELASGIGTVVTTVGAAVNRTAQLVGGFDNLAMIIGGIFASKAIVSVVSFGLAIGKAGMALWSLASTFPVVVGGVKAIGAALMANPIGIAIGVIAGAAYLIYRNWDWIGPWFGKLWDGIKWVASAAWEGLKTIVSWSPLGLIVRAWAPMASKVGELVGLAKDMAGAAWDWMAAKLSWSPLETISNAWGGLSEWFGELWDGITERAERAIDWIVGKLEWVGNAFDKVKGWITWGEDDDADEIRAQLGGGNAGSLGLTSNRERREAESEAVIERAAPNLGPERPQLSERRTATERVREVINNITNNLTLHVTRREGEADASYARRITDMVIEELNARQQGALYDG
ncbi:hypothetical protein HNO53_20800 [Billgrantia antri]|uniref:Phage tail tape measure protein n=1 Tax=Halomonas sulfidivorans TaxID=2733488 RepID=A0ABX7WKJ4_9GAMM|nr:hypothetical protein [Halomonas sulfidivorans]QTP60938.1 hypothetical protein HNO53_20800 [Halomonas sulfidivorans]